MRDNRAYHLQYSAHRAVALALKSGKLVRQPCEVCGEEGQSHHDSYYPDRWLDVRWLCGEHHRRWHEENEPVWPTIFEYHPSDATDYWSAPLRAGATRGRNGRPPRPWFRTGRGRWCVVIDGKHHDLGPDHDVAMKRFHELLAGTEFRTAVQNPL